MSELALEACALGKRFGKKWALRDCTLEVPAGSVAALVGMLLLVAAQSSLMWATFPMTGAKNGRSTCELLKIFR